MNGSIVICFIKPRSHPLSHPPHTHSRIPSHTHLLTHPHPHPLSLSSLPTSLLHIPQYVRSIYLPCLWSSGRDRTTRSTRRAVVRNSPPPPGNGLVNQAGMDQKMELLRALYKKDDLDVRLKDDRLGTTFCETPPVNFSERPLNHPVIHPLNHPLYHLLIHPLNHLVKQHSR